MTDDARIGPAGRAPDNFVIVTPNYNMGEYLADTIESVLENLRPGDQYYVIDGGSTDNSVEVIKRYEHRLAGWCSERDKGYADAIAKGFERGSGTYQCWINSGDLLLKGSIDLARSLLKETGADMIFGDDFYIDEAHRVVSYTRGSCRNLRYAMLYGDWTPLQDACFWRADIYQRTGGLDRGLKNAADYALFAHFAAAGKMQYVPFAFSAFRRHDGQRSIAHSVQYRAEKAEVRKSLVARDKDPWMVKAFRRLCWFVGVRWRVRVLHRGWDVPAQHGKLATELQAGRYWSDGQNPERGHAG